MKRREECSWKLRFFSNKLRNIVSILKVSFEHKNREANDLADSSKGGITNGREVDNVDVVCKQLAGPTVV